MTKRFSIIICPVVLGIISLYLYSCSGSKLQIAQTVKPFTKADSLRIKVDSLLRISKPVMGYRFVIKGDFDGDRISDTLYERYTDSLYQNEAAKYYTSADTLFEYSDVSFINNYLNRKSFIEWKEKKLKLKGGDLGFHYIENCGDVNDDGKDEILVVKQWDDYTNLNTAYIYSYVDGEWKEIYKASVWEWQFPPTPSASMIPGLFGNFEFGTTDNEEDDALLEQQLKAYRFMSYYPDHSVEFSGRNDVGVWDNDDASAELEEIGQQEYIKKYFAKAVINYSLYVHRKSNNAVYYKCSEEKISKKETVILFPLDDGADMITTRIFIKHPQSPFKNKTGQKQ
ncbi:hypothetical protein ACLI1A_16455 [Flavobacterium sp. RHBU_3]|uniref:hypothetical protein n=1 Tax=Flavobacterium sp. RHBU_3 TaxID=3391184 RepID=UPI003984D096